MKATALCPLPPAVAEGIDHMVRNIKTGRFERSLSALMGDGALVTAAETYFEHDEASLGNLHSTVASACRAARSTPRPPR